MSARMKPITDESGALRPDLDFRFVPRQLMALYLGMHPTTLYRHTINGLYERGTKKIGSITYYQPRVIVAEVAHA